MYIKVNEERAGCKKILCNSIIFTNELMYVENEEFDEMLRNKYFEILVNTEFIEFYRNDEILDFKLIFHSTHPDRCSGNDYPYYKRS